MERLRDRTGYVKLVEGKVRDIEHDGRWIKTLETTQGGAEMFLSIDNLECIDKVNQYLVARGKNCEMLVGEKGVVVIDEEGRQIPFEEIVKALFD